MATAMSSPRSYGGNGSSLRTARLLFIGLFHAFAPLVTALPVSFGALEHASAEDGAVNDPAERWVLLAIGFALVIAGGIFAGLTIA
jgi:metal transporter CNNM